MSIQRLAFSLVLLVCVGQSLCFAQVFDEQYSHWPENLKINGRIVVDNGLQDFETFEPLLSRVAKGKNVVCVRAEDDSVEAPLIDALRRSVTDEGSFTLISSSATPTKLIAASLKTADTLFVSSVAGEPKSLVEMREPFQKLIDRGGTIIMSAAVAEILGEWFVVPSTEADDDVAAKGMNLLPNCILRCQSDDEENLAEQVQQLAGEHARTVGIIVESGAALVLSGRKIMCFGSGDATFILPAAAGKPARVESIAYPTSNRQSPETFVVDLTEWRRDAIDRDLPPFPPEKPLTPRVDNGTLIIVGGGGSPEGMMDRFIELAGGVENAKLVYVPCSEDDDVGNSHSLVRLWKRRGVKQATFIHTKNRRLANSDEAILEPLREATGIFFGGGRQWNFADSYYGTKAHELMKGVLKRGGVIAGSSAGASIQARYLARSTPIGNFRIMAPGYERGGLGFISGVAIDQHFSQRGRQKDMTQLMKTHPQLLGIGLDEATAIEVHKSIAKVSGRGRVFFYDTNIEAKADEPDYVALPTGSEYDLARRKVLIDATPASEEPSDDEGDKSAAGE